MDPGEGGRRGVLPYISYIGTSDSQGIIFRVLCLKQGIQFHMFMS